MRTLGEIYKTIVDNATAKQELSVLAPDANFEALVADFVNSSRVGVWKMMAFCMASAIYFHELVFEQFRDEVNAILKDVSVGTTDWYVRQVLDFQIDTPLSVLVTGRVGYENRLKEPNKRVVGRASVEDADGVLRIKVAKFANGNLVALSASEQISLEAYLKKVRFAGTKFTIVSTNGDYIKFGAIRITHNGLNSDNLVQGFVKLVVKSQITNLPFNGRLWEVRLVDALQAISGVVDVVLEDIQVSSDSVHWLKMPRFWTPAGGYFRVSSVENINIITNVVYE
jgi:hypothetical protein